ncbi:MAG TPA: Asd/ArgC dimerization domain-containing protein [Terracidiphilus sp.]|nr:Asd/ArgC dimerization domain-containing protein [Terracidiphilus sp.]
MYKIAIAGASTLLGRELKEVLSESPLAAASLVLLDEEEAQGQLDQVGDEVTFVQAIDAEAFERMDFTFFAGTENLTRKHWRQALRSGSTVLDLSGALDQETGVLIRAPWLGSEAVTPDLFTPAVCPAHPAALALALVLERLQLAAPVRFAAATVLEPASEFGRAAMDELHQQTVSLLSFQSMPRAIYDAQAAYNLLSSLGESAAVSLGAMEARIRRHYDALAQGRWPALALQVIHAPVFHGHTFSIAVELERAVEISALEEALSGEHVDLVLEDTDSPSNLAAMGRNDVLVRLRPELAGARNANQTSRLWLWAASDNLRLNAQNAVECALDLRRLRPQGTVQ